jgi:hypothetical protein
MSALSDALMGIRQILLIQDQVERLEQLTERQGQEIGKLADDLISVDKRVIRIEAMIEISARSGGQPRIEG